MAYFIDNAIAVRIIYLLVTPFTEWDAYKEGIIDDKGVILKKETSDNWTMLHRLVCRLKKLIAVIPGGESKIASYAAAYLLVRESLRINKEPEELEETFATLQTFSYDEKFLKKIEMIIEDAPANVTGNVATVEKPLLKKRVKNVRARIRKNDSVEDVGNNSISS